MSQDAQIDSLQAQLQLARKQSREDRMARLDAERERDELAAQVNSWRKAIYLAEGWSWSDSEGNGGDAARWLEKLKDWLGDNGSDDAPAVYVGRLIADELERIAAYEERVGIDYFYGFLAGRAKQLRQQQGQTKGEQPCE